jgi:hypothetical protein
VSDEYFSVALDDVALQVDDDHVLRAQFLVADARRLDHDQPRRRVARADVAARPRHQVLLRQLQMEPVQFFFD